MLLAAFFQIAFIAVGLTVYHRNSNSEEVTAIPKHEETRSAALTVTSANPSLVDWPVALTITGEIFPWQEAAVGSQIGGYQLTDVLVDVGDEVTKGQVLARFNRDPLLAEQSELLARAEQAEANKQRALSLQRRNSISEQEVLRAVTDAKIADAELAANRLALRYTEVTAPDDGVVSGRTATLGSVPPLGQEMFRLIRQGRLEWHGKFNAAQLSQVQAGQEVQLSLPDGNSASATIRQLAPTVDDETRLATVYADVHPGSTARAGMYVEGSVRLGLEAALVVPEKSLIIRDGRSHVAVLNSVSETTSEVALRPIRVGRRQGDSIEVDEGLSADERVAVMGAGFLSHGDLVRERPSGQKSDPTAASPTLLSDGGSL